MKSFITTVLVALTLFLSACSSDSSSSDTPSGPTLMSIEVKPAIATLDIGTTQQFEVWGKYSDNTDKDITDTVIWSLKENNGVIEPVADSLSFVKGINEGSDELVATSGNLTDNALVIVNETSLVSLAITPQDEDIHEGYTKEYTVTGIYSDGHPQDLTYEASWTIADENIATFDMSTPGERRIGGVSVGDTTVTASFDSISNTTNIYVYDDTPGIVEVEVIPADLTIYPGDKRQYHAVVHYTNGDQILAPDGTVAFEVLDDRYDIIKFGSTNLNRGELEAVSIGDASVRLTYNGVSGTSTVEVVDSFKDITVHPTELTLTVGDTYQLLTYVVEQDDTLVSINPKNIALSYDSSLPNVIDVSNINDADKGTVSAMSAGRSVVTATFEYKGEIYTAISIITVSE
jgi:hypothetical protein